MSSSRRQRCKCLSPKGTRAAIAQPDGTRVVLRGLQGAPKLNGREGVALEHDDAAGRYTVRLDGGEARSVKVKRENVVAKL